MLLRNATLADGARRDVRLGDGTITEIAPAGRFAGLDGESVLDLDGYLLLPALAEPHTHLDKALTAERFGHEFTELLAAIGAWYVHRETLTVDDVVERAR